MTHPTPGYVQEISIKNIRCFKANQTIHILEPNKKGASWTLVLGDNGTGKTTLLKTIAILCNRGSEQSIEALFSERESRSAIKIKEAHGDSIKRYEVKGINKEINLKDRYSLSMPTPLCFAYGPSRRMSLQSLATSESSTTSTLFDDDAQLPNCEEWLLQIDYAARLQDDTEAATRVEAVKKIICDILPDVTTVRVSVRNENRTARPFVEAQTPYGWVSLTELSSGYRTMLAWVLNLARNLYEDPAPGYDGLDSPAVVLVDEIDLHLHPRWQRDLIPRLSILFPNAQFIVTAHSPLIVQAVPDAHIVVLRREGDHVVIDNNPKAVLGWRVDQLLTSDLFGLESARPPALDALLEERRQLLSKPDISEADEARLAEIRAELDALPYGEDEDEMKARDLIARVAKRLEELGEE